MNQMAHSQGTDEAAFAELAKLAYEESGLILVPEKYLMVQSRLRPRMKALKLNSISDYQKYVCSEAGMSERRHMISSLTTNVSHFFREAHHFDILSEAVKERVTEGNCQRIRIWSAGCSNGQEATSIAITLLDSIPQIRDMDFKILATDIDPTVVAFARQGEYPERMTSGLTPDQLSRYFVESGHEGDKTYKVAAALRELISFKELNLLSSWPMKQAFDAIFCRNVVIYFDAKTQASLWPRFFDQLRDDGVFFLGHSERIAVPEEVGYSSIGPTAYVKSTNISNWDSRIELEAKNGAA